MFPGRLMSNTLALERNLNMIGTLYSQEVINDYLRKGLWTLRLTADNCDHNGRDSPDKEALVDAESHLTWAEVSEQSDRLALGLLDLGFKKDDHILVQLPNCVELYLLIIAGEKSGITIVSAQPTFRQYELRSILRHVKAKGVVIPWVFRDFDYFEMIREIKPELPDLEHIIIVGEEIPGGALSFRGMLQQEEGKFPQGYLQGTRFKPYEITRIVTTSGTTGTPKCCEWPTCALMACGRVLVQRWELRPNDIVGAFYNIIGGGLSSLSLYSVPMVGAKVVLLDHFTPQAFCELVERERITIAAVVPTEIARILDYSDLDKYNLSSLRLLVCSTAALPYELAVRSENKLHCQCLQTYGAMDVGPLATSSVNDPQEVRFRTVGHPYDGDEVRVVDKNGNRLPQGDLGEILVKGPTCISGYWNNQELNQKKCRNGWFDTFNQGWLDENGNLVVMGRRGDVIIRGGQNIYPKEVEEVLLQHPKISEVAVVRMPDPEMAERACAYVVPKQGQQITFEEMVNFLRLKHMAPFKLPERLEVILQLPLVPAGQKVDVIRLEKDIAQSTETKMKALPQ